MRFFDIATGHLELTRLNISAILQKNKPELTKLDTLVIFGGLGFALN